MRKISEALKHNTILKIVALIFAIVMWNYVLAATDPPRDKAIKGVAIRAVDYEALSTLDLMIDGDMQDLFDSTDVVVSVNLSEYNQLTADNINVTASFSQVKGAGEYEIRLNAVSSVGTIVSLNPSSVVINVRERSRRTLPIIVQYTGELPQDVHIFENGVTALSTAVEISGFRDVVETASQAVCFIDLSGVTGDIISSRRLTIIDDAGRDITSELNNSEAYSVIVDIDAVAKKTVQIDAAVGEDIIAEAAEGYYISAYSLNKANVTIIGEEEILAGVNSISIEQITASGLDKNADYKVELLLPQGVSLLTEEDIILSLVVLAENEEW